MEAAFGKAKLKGYVIRGSSIFVPRRPGGEVHGGAGRRQRPAAELGDAARREAINGGSSWRSVLRASSNG